MQRLERSTAFVSNKQQTGFSVLEILVCLTILLTTLLLLSGQYQRLHTAAQNLFLQRTAALLLDQHIHTLSHELQHNGQIAASGQQKISLDLSPQPLLLSWRSTPTDLPNLQNVALTIRWRDRQLRERHLATSVYLYHVPNR